MVKSEWHAVAVGGITQLTADRLLGLESILPIAMNTRGSEWFGVFRTSRRIAFSDALQSMLMAGALLEEQ